jgi:hypothetical protein
MNMNPKLNKNPDGEWPSDDEWPKVQRIAVCGTAGCPAEGIGNQVTLYENADSIYRCACGHCGQPITDLREDLTPVGADKLATPQGLTGKELARAQAHMQRTWLRNQQAVRRRIANEKAKARGNA